MGVASAVVAEGDARVVIVGFGDRKILVGISNDKRVGADSLGRYRKRRFSVLCLYGDRRGLTIYFRSRVGILECDSQRIV